MVIYSKNIERLTESIDGAPKWINEEDEFTLGTLAYHGYMEVSGDDGSPYGKQIERRERLTQVVGQYILGGHNILRIQPVNNRGEARGSFTDIDALSLLSGANLLIAAPEVPADTLLNGSYAYM